MIFTRKQIFFDQLSMTCYENFGYSTLIFHSSKKLFYCAFNNFNLLIFFRIIIWFLIKDKSLNDFIIFIHNYYWRY